MSHSLRTNQSGAASIELAAFVPVIALFLLIAFQFSKAISDGVSRAALANADADLALRAWEEENAAAGFARPCIERMEERAFAAEAPAFRLGIGTRSTNVRPSQEVSIVADPICSP